MYYRNGSNELYFEPGAEIIKRECLIEIQKAEFDSILSEKINPPLTIKEKKNKLKIAVQAEKIRVRDSGVTVDGVLFDTDALARISYQEFFVNTMVDSTFTVGAWRASKGVFVVMDSVLFEKVYAAGKKLLYDIFSWQKSVEELINAATTMEALDQINTVFETQE